MAQIQRELGEVLVGLGLVSEEQMNAATQEEARTGQSSWRILLERGHVSERDLIRARAEQIGMEFIDLDNARPAPEALSLISPDLARRQLALPMRVEDGSVVVALSDPNNHLAIEEIASAAGRSVIPAVAQKEDLRVAIDAFYGHPSESVAPRPPAAPTADAGPAPSAPANGNTAGSGGMQALRADDLRLVEAPAGAAPSIEVVDEQEKDPNLIDFLEYVIEKQASDLHLTSGLQPMVRIHGELEPIPGFRRLTAQDTQQIVYAILTQKQREIFEENLELDLSHALPGKARFRVNIFQQRDAMGCVMRLIPFEIKDAAALGLPPRVSEFANLRRGLVLVTGITGSGKSTTLAALVDIINSQRAEHIMTVEDPIEFLHNHKKSIVNQREVGTDTHGFANALKHVLRQDPDVILVGEMRDLETISTALTAAETGHLVFATLHTQDAPQSVDRVIDVFPPHQQQQIRVQLAGTIAGVVSQQLLPTVDGKGRVVAAEVLVATPAVRNLIREGKTHQIYTSMQAGGKFGMQVMDQHLAELVKKHKVKYEMALERAHRVEEFNRLAGKG